MKRLSPGQKATIVFCALFLGTGILSLAFIKAEAVFPALIGSLPVAGFVAGLSYVVFLRNEDAEDQASGGSS